MILFVDFDGVLHPSSDDSEHFSCAPLLWVLLRRHHSVFIRRSTRSGYRSMARSFKSSDNATQSDQTSANREVILGSFLRGPVGQYRELPNDEMVREPFRAVLIDLDPEPT